MQIIEDEYPVSDWNIYPFHFSDGDNWSVDDTAECMNILRTQVQNQVLIRNYNLREFIIDMDVTAQGIMNDMMKRAESNCFAAYMLDFFWKIVQVKLAFLVRQLNWKVSSDLVEQRKQHEAAMAAQREAYERKIEDLKD